MANQEVCRETIATMTLCRLDALAARLDSLESKLRSKLDSVMLPEPCPSTDCCPSPPMQIYPPYFDNIRDLCNRMERSMDYMANSLDRTEL